FQFCGSVRASETRIMARSAARPASVLVEPAEKLPEASESDGDARVRRAVVQIDRIAVGIDGVAARKRHVGDVPLALVGGLRAEYPGVAPLEAHVGAVER